VTPTDEAAPFVQVQWNMTNGKWETTPLSFGPSNWAMAPVGLGDTHNFALHGDQLVRIELKTGVIEEIVPLSSGLLPGTAHLVDREDAPGQKFVYYIQNGDPTRRDRDGKQDPVILASADAVAQVMTPDIHTLLYLSGGTLYGVPAEGGASVLLVDTPNDTGRIDTAFPSTGQAFAYLAQGIVHRVNLDDGSAKKVSDPVAIAGSAAFDGKSEALLFLSAQGELLRAAPADEKAKVVGTAVTAFWPIPGSGKVVATVDGHLRVLDFSAP
jgi:hypothetical protein